MLYQEHNQEAKNTIVQSCDMNDKKIDVILTNALKKDKLQKLKEQAEQGNELAQMILGDIYLYGINTDDTYWKNLDRTMELAKYSKKKNISNYAFTCSCNQEPNYDEALKWYKMAAKSGNADAENKIREINDKAQVNRTNSLIQIFRYD